MGKMLILGSAASFAAHRLAKKRRQAIVTAIATTTLIPGLAAAGGFMLGAASARLADRLHLKEKRPISRLAARVIKAKNAVQ
ncbi:MAG: hypothetical protein ABF461_05550 [Zymomonas mobilis subsp. pomaceae]|uniref:Uncharacterized protein n=1 Tax=Zymomonas mobilis subsp. pomaceae (strain ATCC 29192 / DSM 22645 / JCM 10191 / CCUG 17912 / NBRC 13757 / NCIMB 11200 / NRRL B-4491 / Barker I) TaxID=579138 RepID=F8ET64_ZYMMT|nr:hypothetical protein [Zymomonas mobilis]AEI36954.1 hypothetical protein Zymop_0050 [Zymomonas mobilis subsp. pomaceae ATCC 29192]MDX5948327.1 hypothetical protein [Zymomonas mobilis subsp. pomaceae]GEB89083.1 hypothetical protein ZMO02_07200 [Zymomonas mobilis subsp. pomaceae]